MEGWFLIVVSLCLAALLKSIIRLSTTKNLPPGPPAIPIIGNLIWFRNSVSDLEQILRNLKSQYGPLIAMRIGKQPHIFVSSHTLAYQALIQNGAVFSDRPPNPSQLWISTSSYGPTWHLLRRNLMQQILRPVRIKSLSGSRHWALDLLIERIVFDEDKYVRLIDHFQYAMFSLLVFMCFGYQLEEEEVQEIENVQRRLLLDSLRFNVLGTWPFWISKIVYKSLWEEFSRLRQNQTNVLLPLIRRRIGEKRKGGIVSYVDTLKDLELPEQNNRKLNEWELISLCGEFLTAGTDTTSTALQWIMANLVKYPEIQSKLYNEIVGVMGMSPTLESGNEVQENKLHKMPYLKAVVLEGLRRHPPGHFVLPHKVTRETDLGGYVIPTNSIVNFMVADMNWDPKVWEDPMEFKPERFLKEASFDVTGAREIKMMPFGAGRRMCPASSLAMLHLEYFVANLIWYFEWTPRQGEEIDLTEKEEFTVVMKNPLCARHTLRCQV